MLGKATRHNNSALGLVIVETISTPSPNGAKGGSC